jgi:uncharacterized repeat protein (TIGR01451 family)
MTRILAAGLWAALALAACSGDGGKPSDTVSSGDAECVDRDEDGYGDGCSAGHDCDDHDPEASSECLRCDRPNEGCPCELGTQPLACYLDKTEADDGTVMCHEGTRYCRDSRWGTCEDVHTFPLPPERAAAAALIESDGGPVQCNDCSVNCFRVSDNLDPVDGGLTNNNSSQTSFAPGGGLTLAEIPADAGVVDPPYDPSTCMPGTAPDIDCDGIPDQYDPFPTTPPFATANPGLFLDIGPGETGTGVIDLDFFINSADVYFLVDQSASMADERDRLKADLVSGDFIQDANFDCADVNLNHLADDNGLKSQGIVGGINCIIRNANFGTGFHREIPFTDYAANNQIAFDNYQDITSNRSDVLAAINRLDTIGNIDWPEASMLALNTLVSGNGMYFGTTKRGIPPRVDCPANTWGYPCFREKAIPIVILFTDAMMHNGPTNNAYPYTASKLGITRGTELQYFPIPSTNESFGTSYSAGDLTSAVRTYTGDTSLMTSNIDKSTMACLTTNGGADAFVRFDLTQTRTVRISTEGTRFDTVLGLYAGQPQTPVVLPPSTNVNETSGSALTLGTITGGSVRITGNTSSMIPNYDWSTVQCNADPAARDASYRFDISAPTNVEISTAGSAFDTVVALHSGIPPLAPTYTAAGTTHETLESADNMGAAYNAVLARSGTTSGRTANYQGAEVGCGADNTSPDVVHKFTLAQPTRVRISAEGSSFDTVLALVGDTCGGAASTPPASTDTGGSAAVSGAVHTFLAGSLVIPMDTTYQNAGMLKAYGLVYTLLKNDIPVSWVIRKSKSSGQADFTVAGTNYANGAAVASHGYRGGPFVIDSTDATRAATHITAYLAANPSVIVHRTTASVEGFVRRQLTGAPRFALLRDGAEATARTYLAAAGITDAAGAAWPDTSADVKTTTQIAGASNAAFDGALFDSNGTPTFCGLLSAGWTVAGSSTSVGTEVVRETRQFLESATSLFAQNAGAAAFENGVNGRFLTLDGYNAATAPTALFELNLDSPFAQIDGALASSGGSFGALALPELDDFKDSDAPIFGKSDGSPGEADLWLTARLDGDCSILNDACQPGEARGFVSYLAGNAYNTAMPVTANAQANAVRLFLNSMFATDCAVKEQRPAPTVLLTGSSATTNATNTYTLTYNNDGEGPAHNAVLEYTVPSGASYVSSTGDGALTAGVVRWSLGSLAPDEAGSVTVTVTYAAFGTYANQGVVRFTQGNTSRTASSWIVPTSYTMAGDLGCTALGVNQSTVPATNDTQTSAYDMGELKGRIYRLTGSTATLAANYTTQETGTSCGAATTARDGVFKFHLNQAANVTLSTEGTTGWDTVLSLYGTNISPTTAIAANNTAETTNNAQPIGAINGARYTVTGGTTNSMTANYSVDEIGCTADTASPDAVYSFTVGTPTTVRLSTAGSSFDTVLSLHNGGIVAAPLGTTTAISNTNDWLTDAAYEVPLDVSGRDQTFTGSTTSLTGNFALPSAECGGVNSSSRDAVFKFTVDTTGTYELDTAGSSFDTVLAVYDATPQFVSTSTSYYNVVEGVDETGWGFNMGSATRSNLVIEGDTHDNFRTLSDRTSCSAHADARDALVRFSVTGTSARNIVMDLNGSDFNTVLHLYKVNGASLSYQTCNDDYDDEDYSRISRSLDPGEYVLVITGDDDDDDGDYRVRISDTTGGAPSSPGPTDILACNDDVSGSYQARIPSINLTAGNTYYAIVKGYASNAYGSYALKIRDNSLPTTSTANRVACNDDANSTSQSEITYAASTGTHYVVVKGGASTAKGTYSLVVEDVNNPPAASVLECDDNDGPMGSSMIQRSLGIGDYYVVVKGKTAGASGNYTLRVRDDNAAVGTILECNDDGGADNNALIERDLTPGTYYVIVKGDNAAEGGNYKLSVRDVTNQRLNLLACDDDGAPSQASRINRDLAPGTYYLTVKGDAATSAGAYTLTVQDTANSPLGAIACDDDSGTYKTSVISRSLNAGTYYVAVKGYSPTEKGDYQLTIGGGTTSSAYYVPPTWIETRDLLKSRGVKVIPVLSCYDDPDHGNAQGDCNRVRTQAISLANETLTLGVNNQPLYFDIKRNGEGLSKRVIEGVASLAKYLEMDVRVIVKFDPDANPGFTVVITAIDEIGDGCDGIIGTEHQNCAPGATPRFNIAITNPLPGIPRHPTDPNGGYTFRAQLIGDDQFVVEEVPIYIIPESLETGPEEPPVYNEGTYWQDTTSPGCVSDNQTPDWADLSWDAAVYRNTTIEFVACTASSPAELDTCTPVEVAEITGGADCAVDSDCTVGYCDTDIGVCQITLGAECADDSDCGDNSYCDEDGGRCTYTAQPVYVGDMLGRGNFQRYIRMRINMRVTEPFEDPPVLHRWEMTYYCTNNL